MFINRSHIRCTCSLKFNKCYKVDLNMAAFNTLTSFFLKWAVQVNYLYPVLQVQERFAHLFKILMIPLPLTLLPSLQQDFSWNCMWIAVKITAQIAGCLHKWHTIGLILVYWQRTASHTWHPPNQGRVCLQ